MTRLLPIAALTASLMLGASGCDSLQPSDEPLPSFEELREEFDGQPVGQGLVREDDGSAYETSAVHRTNREIGPQGEIPTFRVILESEAEQAGMTLFMEGIDGAELQPGMQFESLQVSYADPSCINAGGSGKLEVTAVENGQIEGVFAADVSASTFVISCRRRLQGGFHAVFDPPEK